MYTLVIIDDEYEIRIGLSNYFPWEEIGFTVAAAFESAPHALEYLEHHRADVVLSDIKMPRMSGLDFAKILYEKGSPTRVVFLSGYKEFDFLKEALEYRVYNYLLKPITHHEIRKVFGRLKEELDRTSPAAQAAADRNDAPTGTIHRIRAYLEEHYATTSLEDAAAFAHMSPTYLSRYFREKTGEHFSEYLLGLKMKKAAELLKDPDLKTYHISERVGYRNPNNFTRAFRKFFGLSPRDYRNPHA